MHCDLCHKEIYGQYYHDWKNTMVCVTHGVPRKCECCHSFLIPNHFREVSPNRFICNSCIENRVTPKELPMVLDWVLERLYEVGFQDIQKDWVKFSIVDQPTMQSMIAHMNAAGVHYESKPSTTSFRGRYNFDQTVAVLDNLNKIEFAAVLAHELIHAWQAQNNLTEYYEYGSKEQSRIACEGFAQLGSYAIYNWYIKHLPGNAAAKYGEFMIALTLEWDDPAYGVAFKRILQEREKIGWLGIIKLARQNKLGQLLKK